MTPYTLTIHGVNYSRGDSGVWHRDGDPVDAELAAVLSACVNMQHPGVEDRAALTATRERMHELRNRVHAAEGLLTLTRLELEEMTVQRDEAVAELGRMRLPNAPPFIEPSDVELQAPIQARIDAKRDVVDEFAQVTIGPGGYGNAVDRHSIIRNAALAKLDCASFCDDQRIDIAEAIAAALEAIDG